MSENKCKTEIIQDKQLNNIIKIDASSLPVNPKYCNSCPFKPDKQGRWSDVELANKVTARTLFNANQICHGTEGLNRKPKTRCKGSYEHNRTIYKRMGLDISLMK